MNLKDLTPKKIAESVIDFFVTLIAVAFAGSIFIPDDANLKAALPGLMITAAIGLAVWKWMASFKLIDKG